MHAFFSWAAGYRFIRDVAGKKPKFRMGDGAPEITKAGNEVFEDCGMRIMCWSHTYRNTVPRLTEFKRMDKDIGNSILTDIESLQWSALNEVTFRKAYDLLERKYEQMILESKLNDAVKSFFSYFRSQWVESPVSRWWEGSHPWSVSNNQGLSGTNRVIKADHTFKRRCPLGNFFDIVARMVKEWSQKPDNLLFEPRSAILFDPKEGLKLRTDGYQWAKENKTGLEKVIGINPSNKYTVSEAFELGKVDKLWAVSSRSNRVDKSLKDRAKDRVRSREFCDHRSFQEYLDVRTSCWILEERDGDYFCDCPVSMKGKLCHHTVGMSYLQGKLEATSEVRSVPLGQKRKRGRPKKLPGNCLSRSPIQNPPSCNEQEAMVGIEDAPLQEVELTTSSSSSKRRSIREEPCSVSIAEKSAYERIREDNIREREAMFESLGLSDAVSNCHPKPVKTKARGSKRKVTDVMSLSPRRLRSRK